MHYRLNVELTEEQYLDYNVYQNWDSPHGRQLVRRARVLLIAFTVLLLVLGMWRGQFTLESFLWQVPMLLVSVLVQLLINRRWMRRALKGQMRTMKKKGKLGFDPSSVMEFYDDLFTERTAEKFTECTYLSIERITVIKNQMLYLHHNTVGAYLIPRTAFDTDEDFAQFTAFIREHCPHAAVCQG